MSKEFHKGISTIASCFGIDTQLLTKEWTDIYNHLCKHKGRVYAIKFCKELNTIAERYALRQPINPLPFTKSSKDGFPKILNKFKTNLRSEDPTVVMLTLSVFRTIEEKRLPISKDLSTIVEPPSWDYKTVKSILKFIPKFVSGLPELKYGKMKFHLTVKNGPNGPALQSSDLDTLAVSSDALLFGAIQVAEQQLKDTYRMKIRGESKDKPLIHSKLVQFPEKSGKTRTIAIIDYYSQRCLKPIHDGLMSMLRKLKADGTYSHMNVGKFARQKTQEKSYVLCADMTAFTDRFPAIVQQRLLKELLKDKPLLYKSIWTLLAKRTFTVAWDRSEVKYATGQPMGAYASWPLCTLAHHLIVQYSAYKTGTKSISNNYRIIGDDVIIAEEVTAQYYRKVLTNLGLEINLGKTVESHPNQFVGAEVAKQLYLNGTCLTPLTPGFVRDLRKPYMFNTCLGTLKDRYDYWDTGTWPMLIDAFHGKSQKRKKLVWLLTSDPFGGNIKPGEPGYDTSSPWIQVDPVKARARYLGSYYMRITDLAESLLTDLVDYLRFQDGPLADRARSQKPSYATQQVLKQIEKDMQSLAYGDQYCTNPDELEALANEYLYIPNPTLPFISRKELRCKRLSSLKEQVFNSLLT